MPPEVQKLADELGALLSRPVTIADARDRVIAYNVHEAGDRARADSIVMRQLTGPAASWFSAQQVLSKSSPSVFAANPDIGVTHDRLLYPVRQGPSLVALIWVSLTVAPLTPAELEHVEAIAERLAIAMEQDRQVDAVHDLEQRTATADLVASDLVARRSGAEALLRLNLIRPGDGFIAVVLSIKGQPDSTPCRKQDQAILQALSTCRFTSRVRRPLILERPHHGLVIVTEDRGTCRRTATQLAETLHAEVTKALHSATNDWRPAVGIGPLVTNTDDVETSYRHALHAVHVATAVTEFGPVASYDQLGVFRILSQLPQDCRTEAFIGAEVRELIRRELAGDQLARTLETYLDNAGDVVRTAADLHLHRATLYHRLRRITDAVGLDLSDGTTRLSVHLELKLARLLEIRFKDTNDAARLHSG